MKTSSDPATNLPWSARLGYGVGDFALNLFWQGTGFYLLFFYTDVVGLPNAVAGLVFAIGGLWDAFTDPIMGVVAERTRSRWGAYRPYLLLGGLPLAGTFVLLFVTPQSVMGLPVAVTALAALILFKTCYTVVSIPYSTLGARMTEDSDERTRVAGIRMYFGFLGGLTVISLANYMRDSFSDDQAFTIMAVVCSAISLGVLVLCFWGTKSAARRPANAPVAADFAQIVKTLALNKAFLLILAGIVMVTIAVTIISSTILYVFQYGFDDKSAGGTALLIMTGAPLITIPFWSFIALSLGKKRAWLLGCAATLFGLLTLYLSASSSFAALFAFALIALGMSSFAVLFWSMLPDTIEYGEHETKVRNESSIIGVVSSGQKIALAATAYGVGLTLDAIGYSAGTAQSEETIDSLILFVTAVPAAAIMVSIFLMASYPISSSLHRKFTNELHNRHEQSAD